MKTKKNYLAVMYLLMICLAITSTNAIKAQTGTYTGNATVSIALLGISETFENIPVELQESTTFEGFYVLSIGEIEFEEINFPPFELDEVQLVVNGDGYLLSRTGSINFTIPEITIPPIPIFFPNGTTLYNVPATITFEGGTLFNNVITLNIKMVVTLIPIILVANVIIEYEGTLNQDITSFIISATAGENGNIEPDGKVSVNEGENQTFTFIPDEGYEIEDVLVDDESVGFTDNKYTFNDVTDDHTINVTFKMKTYTVTVSSNNELWGTVEGGGDYNHGAQATVKAFPTSIGKFINWNEKDVEVSKDEEYTFPVTKDIELVANFEENVGMPNHGITSGFTIYPNPVKNQLIIDNGTLNDPELNSGQGKIENIEIYDVTGRLVIKSNNLTVSKSDDLIIDISTLTAGVYLIRLIVNNENSTQLFVKE
jgi:hypothetical protein